MPDSWLTPPGLDSVTLASLPAAAQKILQLAGDRRVFLFYGEMGSGKTTFIKALGKQLGVEETMASPTFGLIHEYDSDHGTVYHIDLYRLKNAGEVLNLGMDDYLDSGNYCFIEWPERLGEYPLPPHIAVRISRMSPEQRTFAIALL